MNGVGRAASDAVRPLLEKPAAGVPARAESAPVAAAAGDQTAQTSANSRQARRQQMHRQKAAGMAKRMREMGQDTRSQLYIATLASLFVAAGNLCIASSLSGTGIAAIVAGNSTGNLSGSNSIGNLSGDHTASFAGNSIGNATGNATGSLAGSVTGNATGNVTGSLAGTGASSDSCQHRFMTWFAVEGLVGCFEAILLAVAVHSTTRVFMHEDTSQFIYHMREGSREAEALEEGVLEHAVKPLCISAVGCCCSCCLTTFNMVWLLLGVGMAALGGCPYEDAYFWAMLVASFAVWAFSAWARRTVRD